MGKSVLRSRHRHESHAEMFARVTSFVASPSFSTYAVKESRPLNPWRETEPGYAIRDMFLGQRENGTHPTTQCLLRLLLKCSLSRFTRIPLAKRNLTSKLDVTGAGIYSPPTRKHCRLHDNMWDCMILLQVGGQILV